MAKAVTQMRPDRTVPPGCRQQHVCFVARLADIRDIGFASRLASIAFWPCNAYLKASPTGSAAATRGRSRRAGPILLVGECLDHLVGDVDLRAGVNDRVLDDQL